MITIAEARVSSAAPPPAFFARWADMATWPEWNTDIEWARLDGPFAAGSTGVLKPKGGPKAKFVIAALVAGREFTDVSILAGGRLTFRHLVEPVAGGGSTVRVTVTLAGPLGWFWKLVLGNGLKASLQPDLDGLAAAAESAGTGAGTGAGAGPTRATGTGAAAGTTGATATGACAETTEAAGTGAAGLA